MNDNTNDAKAKELLASLTDEESINLFIEGLMEKKGIDSTSEELKHDIFMDLKTRLMEEIDRSLVAELPDEKLEELSAKAEKDGKLDPEEVANAINEANLNVEEIVGGTMAKFMDIYLGTDEKSIAENESDTVENDNVLENGAL